jgi:hypothetical protein
VSEQNEREGIRLKPRSSFSPAWCRATARRAGGASTHAGEQQRAGALARHADSCCNILNMREGGFSSKSIFLNHLDQSALSDRRTGALPRQISPKSRRAAVSLPAPPHCAFNVPPFPFTGALPQRLPMPVPALRAGRRDTSLQAHVRSPKQFLHPFSLLPPPFACSGERV